MFDLTLPETVDIQAFIACVEHRSFSAAARAMNVPRQTITRRITRLEQVLGVQLLRRSQQEFQLTDTGLNVYDSAKQALTGILALVDAAHEQSNVIQGRLRLTTMPLQWGPLQQMIHDFQCEHRAVKLEVFSSTRYVDLVQENFDVAIRGGTNIPLDAVAKRLGQVRHVVMASPEYLARSGTPLCVDDIKRHRIISSFNDDGSLECRWPKSDGSEYCFTPHFCTNDVLMRLDAAIAGHGLALLPDLVARQALQTGSLTKVLTNEVGTTATFALIYLPSRLTRPVVRTFINYAVSWVNKHTDWLDQPLMRQDQATI